MPTPIPPMSGISITLEQVLELVGPLLVTIGSLFLYAWKQREKTQDKLEQTLTEHIREDDRIHDQLFSRQRDTEKELSELIGEHTAMKIGGHHEASDLRRCSKVYHSAVDSEGGSMIPPSN